MGTWGYKPTENDIAQDLLGDFTDSKNISVLETSLDTVCNLKASDFLDAPTAEQAVAAAHIINTSEGISSEDKVRLAEKINVALKRVVENSELKDLWTESPGYKDWIESVEKEMAPIAGLESNSREVEFRGQKNTLLPQVLTDEQIDALVELLSAYKENPQVIREIERQLRRG